MIKSMTGFGRVTRELPAKKIHVEIKSLNSKQLDINTRFPATYKENELEVRNFISDKLSRGKIDISITVESLLPEKIVQINEEVFRNYYLQLQALSENYKIPGAPDYISTILSLPDTLKVEQVETDEREWDEVKQAICEALEVIDEARAREGAALEVDVTTRANKIASFLDKIGMHEENRLKRIKERVRDNLENLGGNFKIDENRFEQEFIYYIEKIDISEEKTRLADHLGYFMMTLGENQPVGKKLGFITQEIGREINTIGSKANDAEIQKLVIQMKDELEKIKEQSLNIL